MTEERELRWQESEDSRRIYQSRFVELPEEKDEESQKETPEKAEGQKD